MKRILYLIILFFLVNNGCVEPYEFLVENNQPSLVVEGYISNVSYNDYSKYPADARYFTVELRLTGDVINIKDEVVSGALIKVVNDLGEEWVYHESTIDPGTYFLDNQDFEAVAGRSYKLNIQLSEGKSYESEWEHLEIFDETPMGEIGFEEVEKQVWVVEANENVVTTIQGIDVYVDLPKNEAGFPAFYKWDFTPTWIYIAPLAAVWQPDKLCWATNKNYLPDYALQIDNAGGYKKKLFFMQSIRNERLFERFSVLVRQYRMSEDLYYFWEEMQEQTQRQGLFDKPPYNLKSNIKPLTGDEKVSGYFGVVEEKVKRWYFSINDLSYIVQNTMKADCEVVYGPGPKAPTCLSCLDYHNGRATNVKPDWWEE